MPTKELFFTFPSLTSIVSDMQCGFNKKKKTKKNTRSKCSLAACLAGYAPPLDMCTVLCTHKRDFATVTLIPGRCFRSRGGGGSIEFYNNREEEPDISIFPESLGSNGSDSCSFQVDAPPQAMLEQSYVDFYSWFNSNLKQKDKSDPLQMPSISIHGSTP